MSADNLQTLYLPPAREWSDPYCVTKTYGAASLSLCTTKQAEGGENVLTIRLAVQEANGAKSEWPINLNVNLGKWKGINAGTSSALSTIVVNKNDEATVTYELALNDGTPIRSLRDDHLAGFHYSITWGTSFYVPAQTLAPKLLEGNPFCVDWRHVKSYANPEGLAKLINHFEGGMQKELQNRGLERNKSGPFLIDALMPACFDALHKNEDIRGTIGKLRTLLRSELVPILLILGITSIATDRSVDRIDHGDSGNQFLGFNGVVDVNDLRARLLEFERDLVSNTQIDARKTQAHIVGRISLFASLFYMISYMEGAEALCDSVSVKCPIQYYKCQSQIQTDPILYYPQPIRGGLAAKQRGLLRPMK